MKDVETSKPKNNADKDRKEASIGPKIEQTTSI